MNSCIVDFKFEISNFFFERAGLHQLNQLPMCVSFMKYYSKSIVLGFKVCDVVECYV